MDGVVVALGRYKYICRCGHIQKLIRLFCLLCSDDELHYYHPHHHHHRRPPPGREYIYCWDIEDGYDMTKIGHMFDHIAILMLDILLHINGRCKICQRHHRSFYDIVLGLLYDPSASRGPWWPVLIQGQFLQPAVMERRASEQQEELKCKGCESV